MLTPKTRDAAVAEARRFIAAAEKLQFRTSDSDKTWHYVSSAGPVNAAAKRASMDLTRALAELRRPRKW